MANNIGAALGLLGGAVATGLTLRELRKRENEKQGLEAFQRTSADRFIREGIETGTLNPEEPGVQAFMKKVYKDDDFVQGLLNIAGHTYQPAQEARQAIFSPYKTLPEGQGPTIYMPDQLSPQEISQEYQSRIEKAPALLAVANPKAYATMAQQTEASRTARANQVVSSQTSRGNTLIAEAGKESRFGREQAGIQERFETGEAGKTRRKLMDIAADRAKQETSLEAQREDSFRQSLIESVQAAGDRLPAGVTIPEIADFYLTGKASPALQQKLGPNYKEMKAKADVVQATRKNLDSLKLAESFQKTMEAFNAAKRAKRTMGDAEKAAMVDAARADITLQAMYGLGSIPQDLLKPSLDEISDQLPVYYNDNVYNVKQLRAAAADGDESAGMAANAALRQFQEQLVQASGTEGIDTTRPPGTGESKEQVQERLRKGLPPPVAQAQTPSPASAPARAESEVTGPPQRERRVSRAAQLKQASEAEVLRPRQEEAQRRLEQLRKR